MAHSTNGRRHADGSIDFDFYRNEARNIRRTAQKDAGRKLRKMLIGAAAYFKFPQKRWMRRQASSRSSVLVA
jgi:hypothetical protein